MQNKLFIQIKKSRIERVREKKISKFTKKSIIIGFRFVTY